MEHSLENTVSSGAGLAEVVIDLSPLSLPPAGLLPGRAHAFEGLNLGASSLANVRLTMAFHIRPAIMRGSWTASRLTRILWLATLNNRARSSPRERATPDLVRPDTLPQIARRLLDKDTCSDADSGAVLTDTGQPVGNMRRFVQVEARRRSGLAVGRSTRSGAGGSAK